MINLKLIIPAIFFLFSTNVMAGIKYNSEKNIVEISTMLFSGNFDSGTIKIFNEKYIKIFARAIDISAEKAIQLCGKKPSLGTLILDGNISLEGKAPTVTEVENWPETEINKVVTKAGWVKYYVFKDDDALDLMDLLYEYQSVGFLMVVKECAETKYNKRGNLILNFKTRGLERAMKRLK